MALQVGQTSSKTLQLKCERRLYTNSQDGTKKEYNSYYVIVNGIPVPVQVPIKDTTGRRIVEAYFNE